MIYPLSRKSKALAGTNPAGGRGLRIYTPGPGGRKALLLILFLLGAASPSGAQEPVWRVGEELTFKVRWFLIRLATLSSRVVEETRFDGRPAYRVAATIDTDRAVNHLDIHLRFLSVADPAYYTHQYQATGRLRGREVFTRYDFHYDHEEIHVLTGPPGGDSDPENKSLAVSGPVQDSLTLVYWARGHALSEGSVQVPAFINREVSRTQFTFGTGRREMEVEALDGPVEAVQFTGFAPWKGVAGLTGEFAGWLSADGRGLPLKVEMKIALGKIVLELEEVTYR